MNKPSKLYLQRNEEQIKFGDQCYYSDLFLITLPCISKCKVKFENNTTFPLNGYKTWHLTLWEGNRRSSYGEDFLRYLGLKKVTEIWKSLQHVELHNPYYSLDITDMCRSMRIRRAWNVSGVDELKKAYKVLVGKPVYIIRRHILVWIKIQLVIEKYNKRLWNGLIWIIIRTSGWLL